MMRAPLAALKTELKLQYDLLPLRRLGIEMTFEAGVELILETWERVGWSRPKQDLEQDYGLHTVPRPPGSAVLLWQHADQRQEGDTAEADSGGGDAV